MKMRKKPLITLLAGSLLLGSAAAMAYGGSHGFGKGGCDHGNPMQALQQLDNVTDEQRQALRKLFDEQRDSRRDQRDAMRDGRKAVRDAIQSGASTDEVRKLATKQGQLVTDMIMSRAETRQKMASILTPDQMKQLQDYRSDRMERHDRW
jgi:Spy/CpxP family protein refolding chaperone